MRGFRFSPQIPRLLTPVCVPWLAVAQPERQAGR